MPKVAIVGVGRLGGALALALDKAGYSIDQLVHRDPATARSVATLLPETTRLTSFDQISRISSDIVLITTADPDIAPTAGRLVNLLASGAVVLHTSGSLSSDILDELSSAGCKTAGMHPLVSVSDPISGAENFSGAYFCLEGHADAVATAKRIAEALGGSVFEIDPNDKALYHAAAVTASGQLVAVIDIAIEMLSGCGVDAVTAKEILLPLIRSTIRNLGLQSPSAALTGSFARADVQAFERHLGAIDRKDLSPIIREVYLLLGERSLDLAGGNGADADAVQRLRESISIAKRNTGC